MVHAVLACTMGRADRATWAAMKIRNMTAEVVELENVVIEENRHGETIYYIYDSEKNELVWVSTCSNRICEYERHTY